MRVLFASMPFDGHFNPLTGVAVHLREHGHDVRWYTGPSYGARLERLGIPHLPFVKATEVNAENLVERFPEYESLGTGPKAIEFALTQIFFGNLEAHFRDLEALREGFPFEALICDGAFYAGRLVAQKLGVRTFTINPSPTPAPTSRQAPPPFFGLKPARTVFHRMAHGIVRKMVEGSMKSGRRVLDELLVREGLPPQEGSPLDLYVGHAERIFQVGAPGLDFPRTDWPEGFTFVGPLLPHRDPSKPRASFAREELFAKHASVVVVSQGTIDNRDPEKLIVPTLEALAGGPHLVVATTGHRNTEALRARFAHDNVVIEDYVDFDVLLEHADLFVCNGGYGSILLSLMKGTPVLSAGKLEGKNDINARLDWAGLGLDLKTERPSAKQIAKGVARVLGEPRYLENVARVRAELEGFRPFEIIEEALAGARPSPPTRAAAVRA